MVDTVEIIYRSTVQHGPLNRRVYLMKLDPADVPRILPALSDLARRHRYGKILAKVPESVSEPFRRAGYRTEARIPAFFKNKDAGLFMSLFFHPERREERRPETVARSRAAVAAAPEESAPAAAEAAACGPEDAEEMSRLYRDVFSTYPFPIHDPSFLAAAMAAGTRFFCVREKGRIAALGSCEMDPENGAVEMTDFAVSEESRGRGLAGVLLDRMELAMARRGLRLSFTISRSASPAMNITFKRGGYRFAGALVNNTQIGGRIESMWVWYKRLPDSG